MTGVIRSVRNLGFLVVLVVVGGLVLHAVQGGGGGGGTGTSSRDRGKGYEVVVGYTSIRYVLDIQVTVSNHPNPPVKLDATGRYGTKIESSGEFAQPVIYRSGTGGIIVDVTLARDNPTGANATCEIWRTNGGTRTVMVAGPALADRLTPAECRWDRPHP